MIFWIRDEGEFILTALTVSRISTFSCGHSLTPRSHKVMQRSPGDTCIRVTLLEGTLFREPKSFILGCEHAWTSMQQETLCSRSVATNILERLSGTKTVNIFAHKMYRNLKDLWIIVPQQHHKNTLLSNDFYEPFRDGF